MVRNTPSGDFRQLAFWPCAAAFATISEFAVVTNEEMRCAMLLIEEWVLVRSVQCVDCRESNTTQSLELIAFCGKLRNGEKTRSYRCEYAIGHIHIVVPAPLSHNNLLYISTRKSPFSGAFCSTSSRVRGASMWIMRLMWMTLGSANNE